LSFAQYIRDRTILAGDCPTVDSGAFASSGRQRRSVPGRDRE
jgi:hypothetical protein